MLKPQRLSSGTSSCSIGSGFGPIRFPGGRTISRGRGSGPGVGIIRYEGVL